MSHLPSPAEPPVGFAIRNRALHVLLIVSLSLNVLGLGFLTMHVVRKGGFRYILERLDLKDAKPELLPFQEDWRARLRALPDSEGEIVFLGDSIIAQGPWGEFYSPIKNRGIGGETTARVLDRLDEVTESRPGKIFVLLGTNCLASDIPVSQVVRNYRKMLERIRKDSPRTKVYVIGVLPVNQKIPGGPVHDNGTIRDLNDRLRRLAQENENVQFIDATQALADGEGDLRRDLTTDGLHLSFKAYLILGKLLEPYVAEDNAPGTIWKAQASPPVEQHAVSSTSRTAP